MRKPETRPQGVLFDALFHPAFPESERNAIITRFQALFSTEIGRRVMADIDGLITPSVFPFSELGDPSRTGALIAHEAQRSFWTQFKAFRDFNVSATHRPNGRKPASQD